MDLQNHINHRHCRHHHQYLHHVTNKGTESGEWAGIKIYISPSFWISEETKRPFYTQISIWGAMDNWHRGGSKYNTHISEVNPYKPISTHITATSYHIIPYHTHINPYHIHINPYHIHSIPYHTHITPYHTHIQHILVRATQVRCLGRITVSIPLHPCASRWVGRNWILESLDSNRLQCIALQSRPKSVLGQDGCFILYHQFIWHICRHKR